MTIEQRLQEAKDQAAREFKYSSFYNADNETRVDSEEYKLQEINDRAAEIMYEAGKYDTVQNNYTSSIEEAKNKAAREWNDNFDYIAIRNGVQVGNIKMLHLDRVNDRALRLMYEAGKKDGEEKAKFWEDAARNVNAIAEDESDMIEKLYVESNKEAETYRKALEEIRDWEDIHDEDGLDAIDMIDGIQKIASEALKGKI